MDDLRRRHEMALDDLRELRDKNASLEKQLAQSGNGAPTAEQAPSEGLDWEAQKRQILAALETESDEESEKDAKKRLKIEEVIQTTDRVVAEKDREIDELKKLLEEQSSQVGSVAVGAAAFAEMLDQDAIIQEERENLSRLQEELQEKLRSAEIDISIQRAKIARERVEIDEQMRVLGRNNTDNASAENGQSQEPDKPVRGRWLSRLGLKDLDEDGG